MRIGIVGGTFNPIHLGHLMLGEYAHSEYNLDEIWFMPNGNPPHKKLDDNEISTKNRVEMTELAIAKVPYFKMCSYEIDKVDTSYSYETISELKKMYPENEYFFILGSDSLFSIEKWMHPELLLANCTILAATREKDDTKHIQEQIEYINKKFQAYNSNILLLPMPILEISSSHIRKRVREGKSIKYVLPNSIISYIEEYCLYNDSNS